eukprot:TRINITY_DN2564_c0_g2_i1.p1 TRINITY_DN2564_c0_g2~~TRINITY_DN2564_c0_g2_i1.p1  ORF type:complete len:1152 (+),score=346.75 TRINITY_DN2564_c0_g2_i1:2436-5891(+)
MGDDVIPEGTYNLPHGLKLEQCQLLVFLSVSRFLDPLRSPVSSVLRIANSKSNRLAKRTLLQLGRARWDAIEIHSLGNFQSLERLRSSSVVIEVWSKERGDSSSRTVLLGPNESETRTHLVGVGRISLGSVFEFLTSGSAAWIESASVPFCRRTKAIVRDVFEGEVVGECEVLMAVGTVLQIRQLSQQVLAGAAIREFWRKRKFIQAILPPKSKGDSLTSEISHHHSQSREESEPTSALTTKEQSAISSMDEENDFVDHRYLIGEATTASFTKGDDDALTDLVRRGVRLNFELLKRYLSPSKSVFSVRIARVRGLKDAASQLPVDVPESHTQKIVGVNSFIRYALLRQSSRPVTQGLTGVNFKRTPVVARTFEPDFDYFDSVHLYLTYESFVLLYYGDAVFEIWHMFDEKRQFCLGTASVSLRDNLNREGWFPVVGSIKGGVVGHIYLEFSVDSATEKALGDYEMALRSGELGDLPSEIPIVAEGKHIKVTGCGEMEDRDAKEEKERHMNGREKCGEHDAYEYPGLDIFDSSDEDDGATMFATASHMLGGPVPGERFMKEFDIGTCLAGGRVDGSQICQISVLIDHIVLPYEEMERLKTLRLEPGDVLYYVEYPMYGELQRVRTPSRPLVDLMDNSVRFAYTKEFVRVLSKDLVDFLRDMKLPLELYRHHSLNGGGIALVGSAFLDLSQLLQDNVRSSTRNMRWIGGLSCLVEKPTGKMSSKIILEVIPHVERSSIPLLHDPLRRSLGQRSGKHFESSTHHSRDGGEFRRDSEQRTEKSDHPLARETKRKESPSQDSHTLHVRILKACNLPRVLASDSIDPVPPSCYVTFESPLISTDERSTIIRRSDHPQWNFTVDIPFSLITEVPTISVHVWHHHGVERDRHIGTARIDVQLLAYGFDSIQGYFHILGASDKSQGQLEVDIRPSTPIPYEPHSLSAPTVADIVEDEFTGYNGSGDGHYDASRDLPRLSADSSMTEETLKQLLRHSLRFSSLFQRKDEEGHLLDDGGTMDDHGNDGAHVADAMVAIGQSRAGNSKFSDVRLETMRKSFSDSLRTSRDFRFADLSRHMDELSAVERRLRAHLAVTESAELDPLSSKSRTAESKHAWGMVPREEEEEDSVPFVQEENPHVPDDTREDEDLVVTQSISEMDDD